jgi:hypothetical protein
MDSDPIDILYELAKDPNNYWIIWDLYLENEWADAVICPAPLAFCYSGSSMGQSKKSLINRGLLDSSVGSIDNSYVGSNCYSTPP